MVGGSGSKIAHLGIAGIKKWDARRVDDHPPTRLPSPTPIDRLVGGLVATGERSLIDNRRARFEYFLKDTFEAGIVLLGSEVKSLRAGRANLQEAWIRLDEEGATLVGLHISPYEQANRNNHEPMRPRRLLLHGTELNKLQKGKDKGLTIVPTRIYIKGRYIKVEIALAQGKKLHDKRQTIKERDLDREMRRRS
ncbi:MAG: SsrA-binding protein SmpB [Deltaproteobacteria bacterium]|nr:MAG: SsrA-binding protein SmpB [Deltaproteobacteria bacterium]